MFDAVCDECGKDCKVPFRPSGDKPIFCSECFEKKGGRDSNRSDRRPTRRGGFSGRDSGRPSQSNISDRSMSQFVEKIDILNTKLDTIIDLLSSVGDKKSKSAKAKSKKIKKLKDTKADEIDEVSKLVEKKEQK